MTSSFKLLMIWRQSFLRPNPDIWPTRDTSDFSVLYFCLPISPSNVVQSSIQPLSFHIPGGKKLTQELLQKFKILMTVYKFFLMIPQCLQG
ncbi:hypothetical protein GDO81_018496 [Engystomops pustulosus]|uniref:Uncharacterized protein n=1 Tax=Engystomops pustulosus TaxID=76066 RepID=A0AAV6YLE3_ENGPU|nr:hypothetical protein GDO81_018496 [Engystomops pustulosus]